ncbi:MAG: LSU ribosomal protein L15p (L27Ae) [Ktedonobacterales bacterium]|nr:MAG: LSU ribosomal protein L15p (L27Ae) [Ktedonobacterales bacterium]
MRLSDLRPNPGARHHSKRVGRGHGSGRVKTSGRGQKGQKARTGSSIPAYFEGGQNRFSQRMPYLNGFKNPFRKEYVLINLSALKAFEAGASVTAETLVEKGLLRAGDTKELLKVLGNGDVDRALNLTVHKISASARAKIEAAGGSVSLIEMPTPAKTKRNRNKDAAAPTATA